MPTVGVLALQGDYEKHACMVKRVGADTSYIREPDELQRIDALVIPGGESTTIGKLMKAYGLIDPVRRLITNGLPVYGTCAGLILLASETKEPHQNRLGVLEISVQRNAYGRQVDSFEAPLDIPVIGKNPFPGVFIRAPMVTEIGKSVKTLCVFEDRIVLLQKDNILAGSFHPELTHDARVHEYFLSMVG